VIIPNGIDFKEITEINPSVEKSDVIFAGRLIKEKNTDLLLRSLVLVKKSLPNIKCFIIGNGPEKHNLEILRDDLNLEDNVKFLGFLEDHSLISHIKSSLVFTLPSTREGFGMVVLEANACGLPVVVINHPMNASKDLVKDNINGFIAEFSEDSLSDKILEGINGKFRMEDACINLARAYDWDEIVMDLEDFYREVL
jgi:glycosyltransferase involved in cell wall biosynthesis